MEAIKFSELPSGDRIPLADEDGVPIIANQENRLLTWGQLKKQLAEQTHASEVTTNNDSNKAKVPTNDAVANAISDLNDTLTSEIDAAKTSAETAASVASAAQTTAESTLKAASSASTVASEAKTAAESARASSTINDELMIMRLYLCNTPDSNEASSDIVTDRLAAHEINNTDEQARDISLLTEIANGNFYCIAQVINEISADLANVGSGESDYAGLRVEITAGSIDDENGLMTGMSSISESVEGMDAPLSVPETLALIFRNQAAMYQILMDTRKRAIANATNLTAMLTNINAVLTQVMN